MKEGYTLIHNDYSGKKISIKKGLPKIEWLWIVVKNKIMSYNKQRDKEEHQHITCSGTVRKEFST